MEPERSASPPPGAAATAKGTLPLVVLDEEDVRRLLDPAALLHGLAEGFRALARGEVQLPPRPQITVPDKGFVLAMPAWRPGSPVGVKLVSVFEGNLAVGLPNHLAVITLLDADTGAPVCVLDGTHITAVRTAGAAMVALRALARAGSATVTIVGAGAQGREHLALLPLVLPDLVRVLIASRHLDDAQALAATQPWAEATTDLATAVAASDVVCLCTHSYEPVIDAAWVRPGTHVSSVGYAPPRGELPVELLSTARVFVETLDAFAPPPVGCPELSGLAPDLGTALGDVLLGHRPGRAHEDEITVYKAMGIAMEDLVAAELVWRAAMAQGVGLSVHL